jgi:hypothetical protein
MERTIHIKLRPLMGRTLFVITPHIVAASREYLALAQAGQLNGIHVAECFPVAPENVISIWDDAQFELMRRGQHHEFELTSVTVFKNGQVAAQHHKRGDTDCDLPLFAGLDDEPTSNS